MWSQLAAPRRINADMISGDLRSAPAGTEAFLAEAEAAGLSGHAAFARRMLGFLKFLAADVAGARGDLEQALADHDERRDESLRTVFGLDFRSNALAYLGLVAWYLGGASTYGDWARVHLGEPRAESFRAGLSA